MPQLILRRLLALVPLLFLVSLIVFSLVLLIPGDPAIAIAGENATEEQVEATRERLGLNDPVVVQYGRWAGGLLQGDLGTSLFSSVSVGGVIAQRLPVTLSLTFLAVAVAMVIALPAGLIAGTRAGSSADRSATLVSSVGVAIPNFWLGLMLILVFAIWNPWLPATGYVPFAENPSLWLQHMALPAITLGAAAAAELTRQLRSSMVDVMHQDYVRTARSKGLRLPKVVGKHALKNAAIPVVTVAGLQVTRLLGGTIVVEQVFGLPGLGQLAINAVTRRDLPMIQGIVVVAVLVAVTANLVVDLSYGYFNPKVRPR